MKIASSIKTALFHNAPNDTKVHPALGKAFLQRGDNQLDSAGSETIRGPSNEYQQTFNVHLEAINCSSVRRTAAGWKLLGGGDEGFSLWDLDLGALLYKSFGNSSSILSGQAGDPAEEPHVPEVGRILACTFLSDTMWVTAQHDGSLTVWSATEEMKHVELVRSWHAHDSFINRACAFNDGLYAITTSVDKTARVWDTRTGKQVVVFDKHDNEVVGCAVLEDGSLCMTTAEVVPEVANVFLWNPLTGQVLHELHGHTGWLDGCSLNKEKGIAAAVGTHGKLFIWNYTSGECVLDKKVAQDGNQRWLDITVDGGFIAFGSQEGRVRVVESNYGCELVCFDTTWIDKNFHTITSCWFCDHNLDDQGNWESKFIRDGGSLQSLNVLEAEQPPKAQRQCIESPFGRRLASVSVDGTVRIYSLHGKVICRDLHKHPAMVDEVAVSVDQTLLATTTENEGALRLFDLKTGQLLSQVIAHAGYNGYGVDLTRDAGVDYKSGPNASFQLRGRAVTCADDMIIKIWQLDNMSLLQTLRGHTGPIFNVMMLPDNKHVLSTSEDKTIRMWGTDDGHLEKVFKGAHEDSIYCTVLCPNGTQFASCSMDREAVLWDIETGNVVQRYEGHTHGVRHGAFSRDGNAFVTGSYDCTVRLWNTHTGQQLMCFKGHTKTIVRCVYLNDWVVASASRDGTVRCWDVKRNRVLPCIASSAAYGDDAFEDMDVYPDPLNRFGFPKVIATMKSGRVVILDPTYRQPFPSDVQKMLNSSKKLLTPGEVATLLEDFPGLLTLTLKDGNTLLHIAAADGDYALVKALTTQVEGGAPMVLNFSQQTPLDLAVENGHRRCVELLLSTELRRDPIHRLAVLRAWAKLAETLPSLLTKFLEGLGLDVAQQDEEGLLFAPMHPEAELVTAGCQTISAGSIWIAHIQQLRETYQHKPWYSDLPMLKELWHYEEKATMACVGGLPYVAIAAQSLEASPLGILVQNNMHEALGTDIMYAVLDYKWKTFAFRIYLKESVIYVLFVLCYMIATCMSCYQSKNVRRSELYDASAASVIRIIFEVLLVINNINTIWSESSSFVANGPINYFSGGQGNWNAVELLSSLLILLMLALQIAEYRVSRFLMSVISLLLGMRVMKVLSGVEQTGVFVQMLTRIIGSLKFFMLVLAVVLFTYAIAFYQISSIAYGNPLSQAGTDPDFSGVPISFAQMYFFMLGDVSSDIGAGFKYQSWILVLLISFTFIVSIIMLNLLIAIMSDTYAVVKENSKSEWLLLKAKLVMEIESSMPPTFFQDVNRSQPKWLHCLKLETVSDQETLLETIRGPVARTALNTDVLKVRSDMVELFEQLKKDLLRKGE